MTMMNPSYVSSLGPQAAPESNSNANHVNYGVDDPGAAKEVGE